MIGSVSTWQRTPHSYEFLPKLANELLTDIWLRASWKKVLVERVERQNGATRHLQAFVGIA